MRFQTSLPIGHALRVGVAVVGLLLIGVLDRPEADARTTAISARIDAPASGAQVDGVVEIRGRATVSDGGRFGFYRILIGVGRTPASLRPLGPPYDQPVESGLLATWDTDRFPSGEYMVTLHVYDAEDGYETSSTVVTVKPKPTPTPLAIRLPTVDTVPTLVPASEPVVAAGPLDAPPALDVLIPSFDDGAPSVPVLAPIATIAPPRAAVPIQPIPLDPNYPGPFPVDTPTTWSSGQLPGGPAPVYLTPIEFNP